LDAGARFFLHRILLAVPHPQTPVPSLYDHPSRSSEPSKSNVEENAKAIERRSSSVDFLFFDFGGSSRRHR